jgi:zinc protease
MAKLMAEGPTRAELDKIKVQTIAGIVQSLERDADKAGLLATWQVYQGDADGWKTSMKRLEAATPQTVADATKRWLSDGSYTIVVQPFPDYAASGQGVDRKTMPEPGSIADATFPHFDRATLSNGIKVLLAERHDTPQVSISLQVDSGYPADFMSVKGGTGSLALNLLDEGTKTRTGLEIADQLDRLGASVSAGYGGETSAVEMSALTPTLDDVMAIFTDVIRNPAFSEADFDRVKAQMVQGVRQQLRDPNAIAGRVMQKMLWGSDHPYGRMLSPDEVASITREDVVAFHKRWFGPNNATLIVVGDTTMAEITPKLEAAFKGWAPAAGEPETVPLGKRPDKPHVYLVDRPGSVQSVILVGSTTGPRDPAMDTRYSAFNALFGGNFTSRINMNLREDHGWSYGARTQISGGRGPRSFMLTAPVQTDATKGALSEVRKELRDVVGAKPPSQAELDTVRTNTLLGMGSRWETSDAVANSLADIETFHLPDDYWANYSANYRAVTVNDVRDVAKTLIPDQNQIWVVVGDRSKIEAGVRDLKIGDVTVVDVNGDPVK